MSWVRILPQTVEKVEGKAHYPLSFEPCALTLGYLETTMPQKQAEWLTMKFNISGKPRKKQIVKSCSMNWITQQIYEAIASPWWVGCKRAEVK